MNIVELLQDLAVGLSISVVGTYFICVGSAAKHLDDEHLIENASLKAEAERLKAELAAPRYTKTEESMLQRARESINQNGAKAVAVLWHLRTHHKVMLDGLHEPPLPPDMSVREFEDMLGILQNDGLVTHTPKATPGGCEYTWEIAPGMFQLIDDLLGELA